MRGEVTVLVAGCVLTSNSDPCLREVDDARATTTELCGVLLFLAVRRCRDIRRTVVECTVHDFMCEHRALSISLSHSS